MLRERERRKRALLGERELLREREMLRERRRLRERLRCRSLRMSTGARHWPPSNMGVPRAAGDGWASGRARLARRVLPLREKPLSTLIA